MTAYIVTFVEWLADTMDTMTDRHHRHEHVVSVAGDVHVYHHHETSTPPPLDPRIDEILTQLAALGAGERALMSAQDDLHALAVQIGLNVEDLTESGVAIRAAIANLEAQGVDTTEITAAIASLNVAVGDIADISPVVVEPPVDPPVDEPPAEDPPADL